MSEHVSHGPSYKALSIIFGSLLTLTAITVALSYAGLSEGTSLFIAFLIASVKTLLVATIFMHLKFESKTIIIFAVVPVLLAILFIAAISPDISVPLNKG